MESCRHGRIHAVLVACLIGAIAILFVTCPNPSSWMRDTWNNFSQKEDIVDIVPGQVANPVFKPSTGSYSTDQGVSISCATAGAKLYVTTDGSEPTEASPLYFSPIAVAGDGTARTIKVLAVLAGLTEARGSAIYTIKYSQVSTPQFSPPAGVYGADRTISLSCPTQGATIYYSSGSSLDTTAAPTRASKSYSEPIVLSGDGSNLAIKALAVKDGLADASASASFGISYPRVTIVVGGSGSTVPAAGQQTSYPEGLPLLISASPAEGWQFRGWKSSGGAGVDAPGSRNANATLHGTGTSLLTASFVRTFRVTAIAYGGRIWTSPDSGGTWYTGNSHAMNWTTLAASADGTRILASAGASGSNSSIYGSGDGGLYSVKAGHGQSIYLSYDGGESFELQTGPGISGLADWRGIKIQSK